MEVCIVFFLVKKKVNLSGDESENPTITLRSVKELGRVGLEPWRLFEFDPQDMRAKPECAKALAELALHMSKPGPCRPGSGQDQPKGMKRKKKTLSNFSTLSNFKA